MGHFSRECRAQSRQNSNNYQKYKSKEVGKDGSDSKAMVVVDGSIDWDKQTEEGNTEPRSLENFGMIAGIKIESDANSECEVVSANDVIPAGVFVSAGNVAAAVVSPQSKTEFALMGLSTENNSGKNLYKLIDISMSVRTKRGLGLDKYIGEGELGIDDSKVSIFYTNNDELEGQPIYNRSSKPSTNDLQTCDSSVECSRPNHSDHDSTDSIFSISAPSNCDLHEQRFAKRNAEGNGILGRRPTGKPVNLNRPKPVSVGQQNLVFAGLPNSVSTGQQNLVSAGQQNPVSAGLPNPISAEQPNPVSAGQPNPVSAGEATLASNSIPLSVSAGDGILDPSQRSLGSLRKTNFSPLFVVVVQDNSLRLEKEKDRGIIDSGFSRSMSGNKDKLEDFEDFDG
nr:hypothetical protein [Tanacetum cinerariifolium]